MEVLVWIRSDKILSDLALITSGGRGKRVSFGTVKVLRIAAETFTSQW